MMTTAPAVAMPTTTVTVPVTATTPATTTAVTTATSGTTAKTTITTGYGMKLGDHLVPDRTNMAAVRIARKQAKRDANRQHVERAVRRATAAPVSDDEVVRAMVGLKDEQRARRQQQSDAAFGELEERRQRRWTETQNWNQGGGLPEREG
ncbi:hypothetical protein PI125_g16759 [Phytophthora idaei]|nr:hypothetical protein PI125_g16759 [Phytophthora idaei]